HARPLEASAEAAAFSRLARDVQRRSVAHERVLHDGKPQPGAAGFARAPAIDAVEALRQSRQVLGRDADAGVLDVEGRAVAGGVPAKAHLAAFRRIADRVAHEVAQGAGDLLLAAEQAHAAFLLDGDAMAS